MISKCDISGEFVSVYNTESELIDSLVSKYADENEETVIGNDFMESDSMILGSSVEMRFVIPCYMIDELKANGIDCVGKYFHVIEDGEYAYFNADRLLKTDKSRKRYEYLHMKMFDIVCEMMDCDENIRLAKECLPKTSMFTVKCNGTLHDWLNFVLHSTGELDERTKMAKIVIKALMAIYPKIFGFWIKDSYGVDEFNDRFGDKK